VRDGVAAPEEPIDVFFYHVALVMSVAK
jgi:hypothetical protein